MCIGNSLDLFKIIIVSEKKNIINIFISNIEIKTLVENVENCMLIGN